MISYIQIIQLVGFAFLMSTGQMLFKKTAITIKDLSENMGEAAGIIDSIIRAIQIPWFYFALIYTASQNRLRRNHFARRVLQFLKELF